MVSILDQMVINLAEMDIILVEKDLYFDQNGVTVSAKRSCRPRSYTASTASVRANFFSRSGKSPQPTQSLSPAKDYPCQPT